jgi:putative endonuclease
LEDHNRGKTHFAKLGIPWELKYHETLETRKDAVRRELEIKRKKSRKYIDSLIASSSAGQSIPP